MNKSLKAQYENITGKWVKIFVIRVDHVFFVVIVISWAKQEIVHAGIK